MSPSQVSSQISIRAVQPADWPQVWNLLEPVFRAGETYPYSPDISEKEAYQRWFEQPTATYIASDGSDNMLGSYYIKPNQPALGAHVCNCGYVVGEKSRGKGVASLMCEHSQEEARLLGFRAMQFNLVVSTNEAAVYLWQKLGFAVVGNLPGAFHHAKLGFVDALVMYKLL